jgi:hypothetical protein
MVKTVSLGYFPKGLVEPYNRRFPVEFAESVIRDAETNGADRVPNIHSFYGPLAEAMAEGELEIRLTGIWKEKCITNSTGLSLQSGLGVIVPEALIWPLTGTQVPLDKMVQFKFGHLNYEYRFDEGNHLFVPK